MLGLKDYYFPMIEEILDSYEIPLELKYLSVIESALNPRAVSRAGATGLWQFMYHTGRLYNLTVNSFVDERRDPVLATKAAAKYLKDAYCVYKDWVLAIAAYNCGAGNVNKAIHRSGGKTNYWDIYPYLPRETRGYVPAFIAAAYSMTYYKDHGLSPVISSLPNATDTIMITENLHLQQVADVMHIPLQNLIELNPQYRLNIIPGSYSACPLRLPENLTNQFIDLQDSIIKYKHDVFFSGDFKIINPTYSKNGRYASAVPSKNMLKLVYTVKSGDNLAGIAAAYKVRLNDLRYWNDISRNNIKKGQHLIVYIPKKQQNEKNNTIAKNSTDTLTPVKSNINEIDGYIYYHVKDGDSVWKIANQFPGVSDSDIIKWNNISRPDKIKVGQTIKIKKTN
jgi:membrane-bound lytic murein transglycosylase D